MYTCSRARAQIELLDLVALGQEKNAWPGKAATVIDIHMELLAPFGEVRPPSQPLNEEEVFLLQVRAQPDARLLITGARMHSRQVLGRRCFCCRCAQSCVRVRVPTQRRAHYRSSTEVLPRTVACLHTHSVELV